MDINTKKIKRVSDFKWRIDPTNSMNVPVIIYADETLIREMDEKVCDQAANVARLPGIVNASYAMPDAHWGYGFPIGGVAAFDPDNGGVISAGGVGFDIACGVRTVLTGLKLHDIEHRKTEIADYLAKKIPAGLGSTGQLTLGASRMDDMLQGGAKWAVENGYGLQTDLQHIEEHGCMAGAKPDCVSDEAKKRQRKQLGTLGSGNHYFEVQYVTDIYDDKAAHAFGLAQNDVVVSIHCGSRGLGHQIATDYLKKMVTQAGKHAIKTGDRELACAPINSKTGKYYLAAMHAGINCAMANRQVLTHLLRKAFAELFPAACLSLLYDVSHNTCKVEQHNINGKNKRLFVHRKGATRSFGPGFVKLPEAMKKIGQPVLIGGTMGTASYILVGTDESMSIAFGSSCHGAGRTMSRTKARKKWQGKDVVHKLAQRGVIIRSPSYRGVAEEAPDAYKNVAAVVEAEHHAKLSKKVAKLKPLICIKG